MFFDLRRLVPITDQHALCIEGKKTPATLRVATAKKKIHTD
jgi:hypothetical protein